MHDDPQAGKPTHFDRPNPSWADRIDSDADGRLALGIVCELAVTSFDASLVSISLGARGEQTVLVERGGGDGAAARRLALHDEAWGMALPLVVADLRSHKRLRHLPDVIADGGLRFYAGMPLSSGGEPVGVLGVHGVNPHTLDVRQHEQLGRFGLLVEHWLDRQAFEQRQQSRLSILEHAASLSHLGAWMVDLRSGCVSWSRETYALLELPDDVTPAPALVGSFWTEASRARGGSLIDALFDRGIDFDEVLEVRSARGRVRRMRVIGSAQMLDGRVACAGGSVQPVD